ncbi:sucrose nonfermenting 4-like protein isoform X1 [Dioscorea cayenensis subsp. rotundata]|uniref:Sucrose nonfermenting 4-like protein isoform X1 n=1 Tax=Dioscorea cayennensis subsp. rotundata TaxID=55577 RepID=A0AB40BGK3_DIOCR|nr:sucrose nonfermenting 4-like protein isoform X1 [Dioscorea cayenensis subsp. rotundata]
MVLVTFSWPYGGRQVLITGTFTSWTRHYQMTPVDGSPGTFQSSIDLLPGYHQYRFLADGIWRCDERQPCISDGFGVVNNWLYIAEPDVAAPALQYEPHIIRTMDMDEGTALYTAPSPSQAQLSETDIQVSRSWISRLLSSHTVYDTLPMSSKVVIIDAQMPVKKAFQIMYEEGLFVVPIWDELRATVTGMLTASDFISILKGLQENVLVLAEEELDNYTVSAWKEIKFQQNSNGPVGMHRRPVIHASDQECLKDVALKIVRNEISSLPVFKSSSQDTCMPLLTLACLPGVLKYIFTHYREPIIALPLLQHPICRIPLGTWLLETGRGNGRQLAMLGSNSPLSSALQLLLEGRISTIPIVDDSGSLVDIYSRSDILALAKGDMYAHIQPHQMTMHQALQQVYQANSYINGRRRCHTCFRSSTLHEVMDQLSDPAVRRLVIVDAISKRVEGIISLRDVLEFLLH